MQNKKQIYGSDKYASDEDESEDDEEYEMRKTRAEEGGQKEQVWTKPIRDNVKVIDFGGATYESEYRTSVINTR